MAEEVKKSKCVKRFSICRDILQALADYLSQKPYKEVLGYMRMLQEDPIALGEDGLPIEKEEEKE